MKTTVRELMEKIYDLDRVIDALHELPHGICKDAENYLDEYVDMLKDTKVDI